MYGVLGTAGGETQRPDVPSQCNSGDESLGTSEGGKHNPLTYPFTAGWWKWDLWVHLEVGPQLSPCTHLLAAGRLVD